MKMVLQLKSTMMIYKPEEEEAVVQEMIIH